MLEKIRSTSLKKAGYISIAVGMINIVLHILVITAVLPYQWVNGGRTASYTDAVSISSSSIVITVISMFITLLAAQIIPVHFNRFFGIALSVFLIATLPFDVIGIIQQFLGTPFEKCFTSILTIVVFLADTRVAFEKRWPEKILKRA